MMTGFFKLGLMTTMVLVTSFGLGLGTARLMIRDRSRAVLFAPWIGIAQTGILLIFSAFLGFTVREMLWLPLAAGAVPLVISFRARHAQSPVPDSISSQKILMLALGVFCAAWISALPAVTREGDVSSFTIGNQDLFEYSLTAEILKDHDVRPFVKPFGGQPDNPDATIGERVASWQVPSTRWVPIFYLSYLSSVLRLDSSVLFSILICAVYALFLPLLWLLARDVFEIEGWGWTGFALALVNPHMIYVLYHGFLPQILATGFLIGFYIALRDFAESGSVRGAALAGLFAAGVLATYLELFVFAGLTAGAYFVYLAAARKITVRQMFLRGGAMGLICAALAPYQTYMLIPIILFHSDWAGGGWNLSKNYYLFATQIGLFRYDAQWIIPYPLVEKAGGALLLAGLGYGLFVSKSRALLAAIAAPFLISGFSSYAHNWNYRYFKNMTYIYFWAPLMLGWLVTYLMARGRTSAMFRRLGTASAAIILMITLYAGSNSALRLRGSFLGAARVPQDNSDLKALNQDPTVRTFYVRSEDPWETLWIGYRLRDKNLVFDTYHPYLRNDLRDPKAPWNGAILKRRANEADHVR